MSNENDIDEVLSLRNNYRVCLKLADETDSKKEDSLLRAEARDILFRMQNLCTHEHIVMQNSMYEGSSCNDYDDRAPERRICLCCGKEESSYREFGILKTMPFSRFESSFPQEIKTPLNYLLADVIEVAREKGYRIISCLPSKTP